VATFVGRFFFGVEPAFSVSQQSPALVNTAAAVTLVFYAVLGALTGVAAAAFIRGLHAMEDLFERIHNRYLRHGAGMLLLGIMILALQREFGHYYIEGVGYSTVQAVLLGQLSAASLLLLLFFCKLLATSLSLGSGASGGVFSPSLFMGATLGGGFGALLTKLHLPIPIDIASFAIVGMGAMVGGGTGAVMAAVTMIFEMTHNYDLVMPLIVAVAVSVGVRRLLSSESIYSMKLYRRGHSTPKALHANMFLVRRARDVMATDFVMASSSASFDAFLSEPGHEGRMRHVVVRDGERIVGVVRVNTAIRQATAASQSTVRLGDIATRDFSVVRENDVIVDVIHRMWHERATVTLVTHCAGMLHARDVVGVISKEHVADCVAHSTTVYPIGAD
jgi:CIC family chloride channel protein